ncbi:MAG: OsmC family protein [Chloroflexota bacterium]
MFKATVILPKEGYKTTIYSGNHIYHSDEPIEDGGTDQAPTPTQMIMGALGSCIAITMRLYADRKGWALDGVEIELDFERFKGKDYPAYDGDERYVHEITKKITLQGALTEDQRERIIEIGGMCPVHRLIASPTFFVEEVIAQEQSEEARFVDEIIDNDN